MQRRYIVSSISLLIGVLIIIQSLLGNIVAGVWQGWLGDRAWVISIPFLIISALLLGYDLNTFLRERTQQERVEPGERNRQAMLEKVRATWIAGVLDQSLYKETLITLGLHTHPDAVARPMDVLIHCPRQSGRALPLDKPISQVYDELNGAMLILGAPGAGKTTLLLELTRDLLDRAKQDPMHPIPVVFPLSSWAEHRRPLVDWFVEELHLRYGVPRAIAHAWIDANAILPLLDGLDEVAEEHRTACVDAINTFRQDKYGLLPLVVSSRIADYDVLTVKLRLDGAIVVQPLTREQVRSYLRQVGITITPKSTSPLWELLDSPLMLNIAIMTYAEPSGGVVHIHNVHQDQLFSAYIERMFQRNNPQLRFSQQQTTNGLGWLAWQMQRHNQTVFYLKQLQPDWLTNTWLRLLAWAIGMAGNLLILVIVMLGVGTLVGLIVEPFAQLTFGMAHGVQAWFYVGLIGGMIGWMIYALGGILDQSLLDDIQLFETTSWSKDGLWAGLIIMVGSMLAAIWTGAWIVWLAGGLLASITAGVLLGVRRSNEAAAMSHDQSIWHSLLISLRVGMISGIPWIIGGLAMSLFVEEGFIGGLALGVIFTGFGLAIGLSKGGSAVVKHYALRCVLWRSGAIPWAYVHFLDFAAQRILLRKVGGGYIFIHRLLLEYFAAQYTGPETTEVNATSKGT